MNTLTIGHSLANHVALCHLNQNTNSTISPTRILTLVDRSGNLIKFLLMSRYHYNFEKVQSLMEGVGFKALLTDKAFDVD